MSYLSIHLNHITVWYGRKYINMWHTNSKYFYFTLKHRQQSASGDLFTKYDVDEITARISNHTSCLMWDVITRPGYSFNGGFKYTTFEVKAMICNCEQLYYTNETRTTRTPAFWDTPCRPMITHTCDSHQTARQNKTKSKFQIKKMQNIQIVKFCRKLYKRHTFWSCLIRYMKMKWIQPEL